jgi:hypothetical protein
MKWLSGSIVAQVHGWRAYVFFDQGAVESALPARSVCVNGSEESASMGPKTDNGRRARSVALNIRPLLRRPGPIEQEA